MHLGKFLRLRPIMLALAVLLAVPGIGSSPASAAQGAEGPSIRIVKRTCEGISSLPVFVESHCTDVPDATFNIDVTDEWGVTVNAGESWSPEEAAFDEGTLWAVSDASANAADGGVRVMTCLASEPGTGWRSAVPMTVQSEVDRTVSIDWIASTPEGETEAYRPSLDCTWLELPDLETMPAVVALQVFTADEAYLNWTERSGGRLPEMARGESGEDLEAGMAMTNVDTGEAYTFAADAEGQVLVPEGTYEVAEVSSGLTVNATMLAGETVLVEVGLGGVPGGTQPDPVLKTFGTGVLSCEGETCEALTGVTISYASTDGSVQGACVTEAEETPNGMGAWCEYEYVPGVPTVLTLDESTLPPGLVVTSENPQMYLVPENPDGVLSPVYFRVGPA